MKCERLEIKFVEEETKGMAEERMRTMEWKDQKVSEKMWNHCKEAV